MAGEDFSVDTQAFSPTFEPAGGGDALSFGFGNAGPAGPNIGLFYDTLTGQYVTPDQAQLLDPTFGGNGGMGTPAGQLPAGSAPGGNGDVNSTGTNTGGSWMPQNMNDWLKLGAAALGLGTAGLGAAGIAQGLSGGARQGTSTTGTQGGNTFSQSTPGPMSPELQYLYSQMGGPDYGGLQGLAGHSLVQNMAPNGLMNQQAGILGQLYGNAPNADPYLQQQLIGNARGMAAGNLPALTPDLQNQINNIYGSQWNNINRYLEDYLGNVRDQMNNQGWEGGQYDVLRQGPGQALMAPAIREATRQQGLLAGQAAQSSINLAQQLPMQAAQLGTNSLAQGIAANQNQQNIANAFNTPIALRNQLPTALFQGLNQNRGTTTVGNTTGNTTQSQQLPGMTLLDAFQPAASLLGGLGGLAGGAAKLGATQ